MPQQPFAPDPCLQASLLPLVAAAQSSLSADMERSERISQWVASQEIPSDLTIRVGDSVFPLHKAVMVPKCGYIRRAVAAACKDDPTAAVVELDLSAVPGGADAFEKAARYCYGANFEITPRNAAALRCAAAFLDVQQLAQRVDEFLAQAGLRTLHGAVAVLRSCECPVLLPAAEELGLARRAADAVALRVCNEALFPTRANAPPGWWTAELAALSPASFGKVATALRCRRADPAVIAAAAAAYAELALAEVLADPSGGSSNGAALIESVVDVLPSSADAPLPASFLCRLLHAAVNARASTKTCRDLELRVAAVLDQATAADLLGVALDGAGERVTNTDTVRRVVAAFVERLQRASTAASTGRRTRRASLSGLGGGADEAVDSSSRFMEKVARTVDEVAAEIATEASLPVSKFVGVAGAVPKDARGDGNTHDLVYRAVDIYLKTHPALDEIEREKVCSVMDPLKLSYNARLHASQNSRLPLQIVLSALYYDNLKLRSTAAAAADERDRDDVSSDAGKARAQAQADASLARENEALRSELARMQAYVSGMQHSKGSGSRASSSPAGKKASGFLGSVSSDAGKTTTRDHVVVKPKRRRFSIS